jgi:hypothetical protein
MKNDWRDDIPIHHDPLNKILLFYDEIDIHCSDYPVVFLGCFSDNNTCTDLYFSKINDEQFSIYTRFGNLPASTRDLTGTGLLDLNRGVNSPGAEAMKRSLMLNLVDLKRFYVYKSGRSDTSFLECKISNNELSDYPDGGKVLYAASKEQAVSFFNRIDDSRQPRMPRINMQMSMAYAI